MGISDFTTNKIGTVLLFICLFYQIPNVVLAENKEAPIANLKLPPFLQWRNVMFCLRDYKNPNPCPWKYTLNLSGSLNVEDSDGEIFCKNGCADHTRDVLKCIHNVKRHFWFANKATIKDLNVLSMFVAILVRIIGATRFFSCWLSYLENKNTHKTRKAGYLKYLINFLL